MSLSRVKTWTAEVLTASDLNAEFNNILTYLNATTGTYGGTFGASDGLVGTPSIYFSSDTDTGYWRPGANSIAISAGGTEIGRWTAAGLGIGMTPTNMLDITQTQNAASRISIKNSSAGVASSAGVKLDNGTTNSAIAVLGTGFTTAGIFSAGRTIYQAGGQAVYASTGLQAWSIDAGANPHVLLDASGSLIVGNTAVFSTEKFQVTQTAASTIGAIFANSHATPATATICQLAFATAAPNDTTAVFMYGSDTSTQRFRIYSNGNIVNVNNSYGAISTREVKQDIVEAADHTETVKALADKLFHFRLKTDVVERGDAAPVLTGGIAEEWETVAPDLVFVDGSTGLKCINYSGAYTKALGALGAALKRIDVLEARLTAAKIS